MKKTVLYTPTGNNPEELTLIPPVVGDIAEFKKENGLKVTMSAHYANKIVADNPTIFKIVPYVLPNPFTAEDLLNIEDLDKLESIGLDRFGIDIDKRKGVTAARELLIETQEKKQADSDEWPKLITEEFLNTKKVDEIKVYFDGIDFTGLRSKKDVINHVLEELSKDNSEE